MTGLTARPRTISSKFFYDDRGSRLFEEITRLPEYYLARTEMGLIPRVAEEVCRLMAPDEIIELGPGSTEKVRAFLASPAAGGCVRRYVPFDVDPGVVRAAVDSIGRDFPQVEPHGVVGDLLRHVSQTPTAGGRRLVVFFGSTIGNFDPEPRRLFLASVRDLIAPDGMLLMGLDLVKDVAVLEAAYNDGAGVTAEFNKNILNVVNREAGADFDPKSFGHRAFFNDRDRRIEMHLVSERDQSVTLSSPGIGPGPTLERTIDLRRGETIWTESSYKFDRAVVEGMLRDSGLSLQRWYTDPGDYFALALIGPA